jgi:hypothetical protein
MDFNIANKSVEDKPLKKVYHTPQLAVYGNISEVTRAVNPLGEKNDSALPGTGKDKT